MCFPQVVLPVNVLVESVVQLGVCEEGSAESRKMAGDYLRALQAIKEEQLRGKGRSWAEVQLPCSSELL